MRYGPALRAAHARVNLSQAALARLARTSQSAIARSETDAAVPALPTLERILAATGGSLTLGTSRRRTGRSDQLRRSRGTLVEAGRARGVSSIGVFGSTARGDTTPTRSGRRNGAGSDRTGHAAPRPGALCIGAHRHRDDTPVNTL